MCHVHVSCRMSLDRHHAPPTLSLNHLAKHPPLKIPKKNYIIEEGNSILCYYNTFPNLENSMNILLKMLITTYIKFYIYPPTITTFIKFDVQYCRIKNCKYDCHIKSIQRFRLKLHTPIIIIQYFTCSSKPDNLKA